MSYTFYSFRDRSGQDEKQWQGRTVEGETRSCYTRTLVEIFNSYLPESSPRILEAGCGLGGWVNYFRRQGYDIIGVEYDNKVVRRVKEYDASFPIEIGDVTALNFLDNSFDVYISLGVIEHFQEGPMKALQEARRVLKPRGRAFITVPYLNNLRRVLIHPLRNIFFFVRRMLGGKDYFWEYRYTQKELSRFLEEAGFKIVHIGIDDYIREDKKHHIGLYADFFFLRKKGGEIWELNNCGRLLLSIAKNFSPWLYCSGLHIVAVNEK